MKKLFKWIFKHFIAITMGFSTLLVATMSFMIEMDFTGAMVMLLTVFMLGLVTWFFATDEWKENGRKYENDPAFVNDHFNDDGESLDVINDTISDLKEKIPLIENEISDMKTAYDEIIHLMNMQESKRTEYSQYLKDNAEKISSNIKKTTQMRDQLYAQIQILEGKQSELAAASVMTEAQEELNRTLYGENGLEDVIKDLEESTEFALNKSDAKLELNSKNKKTRNWPGAVL